MGDIELKESEIAHDIFLLYLNENGWLIFKKDLLSFEYVSDVQLTFLRVSGWYWIERVFDWDV